MILVIEPNSKNRIVTKRECGVMSGGLRLILEQLQEPFAEIPAKGELRTIA